MISELQRNPQNVVLIPAPESKHEGHMIRVCDNSPPEWYADLYFSTYRVNRKRTIRALERLKEGIKPKSTLDYNVLELVEDYSKGKYYPC